MKTNYKLFVLTPLVVVFTGCASHKNTVNNVCGDKLEVTDQSTQLSRIVEVKDASNLKYFRSGDEVEISALGYKSNRVLKKENLPIVRANQDSIHNRQEAEKFTNAKQNMIKNCPECQR